MNDVSELDIEGARRFHGHSCPGLAIGIRAAQVALREIGAHAKDEEIVAIVETDNCAVDAIQYLTGCTFGKGNLIFQDYGKNAFTFIRRLDGKAIRLVLRSDAWQPPDPNQEYVFERVRTGEANPEKVELAQQWRQERINLILQQPLETLFRLQHIEPVIPQYASIHNSVICSGCGEKVMETRVRLLDGRPFCIPCFKTRERRF